MRSLPRQPNPHKMPASGNLPAVQMPFNPHPVIQRLQRQMNVLIHLQLNHRETSIRRHAQKVEQAAIACTRNRWNLCVHMLRIESRNYTTLLHLAM